MNKTTTNIQESLARALNALPGVFSSVQWGGRAYKLPGPGSRGLKRPVLLAHVWIEKGGESVGVAFKLDRQRAKTVLRQHDWLAPHSFRTLAPSGWITAEIRTKAQCRIMLDLLRESRSLHPMPTAEDATAATRSGKPSRNRKRGPATSDDPIARRIDSVLQRKREEGWRPQADAFDD